MQDAWTGGPVKKYPSQWSKDLLPWLFQKAIQAYQTCNAILFIFGYEHPCYPASAKVTKKHPSSRSAGESLECMSSISTLVWCSPISAKATETKIFSKILIHLFMAPSLLLYDEYRLAYLISKEYAKILLWFDINRLWYYSGIRENKWNYLKRFGWGILNLFETFLCVCGLGKV